MRTFLSNGARPPIHYGTRKQGEFEIKAGLIFSLGYRFQVTET